MVTQQQKLLQKMSFFFQPYSGPGYLDPRGSQLHLPRAGLGGQQEPGRPGELPPMHKVLVILGDAFPHTQGSTTNRCPSESQETWETNGDLKQNFSMDISSTRLRFFAQGRQCGHSAWG